MKRYILLALLLLGAAFWYWAHFYGDAWLAEFNDERAQTAAAQLDRGRVFGQNQTQQGCFDSALEEIADCRSPICTVDTGHFLRGCWERASETAGFCDGVPAWNDKISEDEKSWARYGCWDMNNKSDGCRVLMRQRQQLCSGAQ